MSVPFGANEIRATSAAHKDWLTANEILRDLGPGGLPPHLLAVVRKRARGECECPAKRHASWAKIAAEMKVTKPQAYGRWRLVLIRLGLREEHRQEKKISWPVGDLEPEPELVERVPLRASDYVGYRPSSGTARWAS